MKNTCLSPHNDRVCPQLPKVATTPATAAAAAPPPPNTSNFASASRADRPAFHEQKSTKTEEKKRATAKNGYPRTLLHCNKTHDRKTKNSRPDARLRQVYPQHPRRPCHPLLPGHVRQTPLLPVGQVEHRRVAVRVERLRHNGLAGANPIRREHRSLRGGGGGAVAADGGRAGGDFSGSEPEETGRQRPREGKSALKSPHSHTNRGIRQVL